MSYGALLRQLEFPQWVIDAHEGKIAVPKYSLTAPFDPRYGFPPIMIPLWSDGAWPGYIGIVISWFGGCERGFIKYYSSSQYASEIALTFDQLKVWLAFDFLCNIPEVEEVGNFAQSIGLCEKNSLEEYFANCRDYPDLLQLDVFKSELPQLLIGGSRDSKPSWVQPSATKTEVLSLIEKGEYQDAWYCINSPGLTREDVVELMVRIAPFSSSGRFGDLVECWVESTRGQ